MQAKRFGILLLAAATCTGCDQATKQLARTFLEGEAPVSFLSDSLRLVYAENAGAFLGLGANWPGALRDALFLAGVPLMLVLLVVYFVRFRAANMLGLAAAGLMVGGGLSNLVDRVLFEGLVTDFLNVGLGPLRTGVFNLADTAVLVGAVGLVWTSRRRPPSATV